MSEDMRDSPRASLGSAANMVWSFDIKGQNGDVLFGQEPHPWVRTPQRAPPLFLGIASRQRGGHAVTTYKWYAFCGYVWKEDAPNPVVHHDCSSSTGHFRGKPPTCSPGPMHLLIGQLPLSVQLIPWSCHPVAAWRRHATLWPGTTTAAAEMGNLGARKAARGK